MCYFRSKNQELNTYINSFIDINYQPKKMFWWRILILCLFGLLSFIKDYQYYSFSLEYWLSWTPLLVIIASILTINLQSLYLGSMCYQYRHHDTSFQIARKFPDIEYSPLISGLERKLRDRKRIYYKSYAILFSLLIGLISLISSKSIIWQTIVAENIQYLVLSIYIFLVLALVLVALITSISIVARKRQAELIELSLFWIKSASSLKYIEYIECIE